MYFFIFFLRCCLGMFGVLFLFSGALEGCLLVLFFLEMKRGCFFVSFGRFVWVFAWFFCVFSFWCFMLFGVEYLSVSDCVI